MMRIRFLAPLLCAIALPVMAQSTDVGAWYESATVHRTNDPDGVIRFNRGNGWGVSVNHFWLPSFSTELAYATTRSNGHVDFPEGITLDAGRLRLKAATAVAQWHFIPRGLIDPYVGAGAARVTAGSLSSADLSTAGVSSVHISGKTTWVANAGVNVNLTKMLAVAVDGKYVRYRPDSRAAGETASVPLKLNPTFIAAGVKLRF
jgi:outer membrane protein W